MLINLSEVFTCEGKRVVWETEFTCPTFRGADGNYKIISHNPVKIEATNLGKRKLSLKGGTKVTLEIPCARCLTPVEYTCDLEFDEELDMAKTEEERRRDLDEQTFIDGYNLDVDRLVKNELTLALPMRILCREDCKGICSRCGANLNLADCGCDRSSLEPRMAVIQDLFKKKEN